MSRISVAFLCASLLSTTVYAAEDAAKSASGALDPKNLKPPTATPAMLEKGKAVYTTNCLTCHGESGHGDGPAGMYMNPKPRDFAKDPFKQGSTPAHIFVTITEGVKNTTMIGWSHLPEDDRWALAHYVLTMVPKEPEAKK